MKKVFAWVVLWLALVTAAQAAPWAANCIAPISAGQTVNGQLTSSDCYFYYESSPTNFYRVDVYSFSGTAGQQISIAMNSGAVDAYLEIYSVNDIAGTALAYDDDSGGGLNARLPPTGTFTLPATGTYYIWAGTALPNQTGTYTLTLTTSGGAPSQVTVVEFYHPGFNHYFITGYPEEAASLSAGNLPPWVPTGQTFLVWGGPGSGITNVCRFFSATFAPRSSHFYSGNAVECPGLASHGVWSLEAQNAFYMMTTATGACPSGTIPLYRLYNNGMSGAPNHRYTTSGAVRTQMIGTGWIPEGNGPDGVFACVLPGGSGPTSDFQREVTGYADTILGLANGQIVNTDQLTIILRSALSALTSTGSTCPVATSNPPLASLTTFPPNLTISVSYGSGCNVPTGTTQTNISGSAVITASNLAVTDTSLSGALGVTFNNLKINNALVANGAIQATFNLAVNASTSAITGPVTVTLNGLQLPTLGVSGTVTINLSTTGTTTVATNLTTSPHNVVIRLNLNLVPRTDGALVVNSTGSNTVGAYAVQFSNVVLDSSVCTTGAIGGTVSFTKAGQTGTLTFGGNCRYTYSGP